MRIDIRGPVVLLAIAAVQACALLPPEPSPPTAQAVTMADATACPVTLPGTGPPAPDPYYLGADAYGNGQLWVGLWSDGVIVATPDQVEEDGSIGMKVPWYRGQAGELTITGRRLDADAPAAWAEVPDGYGERGFLPSGIHFPSEGCWEVTGRVGGVSLTFVTFVVRAAAQ
jgi:hypothetical protein